jgi:hypothetical protein
MHTPRHGGCRTLHQFETEPVDESDLLLWEARLYDFDKADPLAQDLSKRGLTCVTLRIRFPSDFPSQASMCTACAPHAAAHVPHAMPNAMLLSPPAAALCASDSAAHEKGHRLRHGRRRHLHGAAHAAGAHAHARHMHGTCSMRGHARHMHGTCTAHAACRGMHGTCTAHARHMQHAGACTAHAWHTHRS